MVPARFCSVAGVSVARKGVLETNTQKSLSRVPQQSVRFQMVMLLMVAEEPRSTCHQALVSGLVAVTEPSKKAPSVFPSTAADGPELPDSVLLCVAVRPSARLVPPPSALLSEKVVESPPTVAVTV